MSKARLVITAVVVEGRSQGQVAGCAGASRGWVWRFVARYGGGGEAAFEPRSRRPQSSPSAVSHATVELIVRLRKDLADRGLDAGPHTICWHLEHHHQVRVSAATVSRYLTRQGLATPDPRKRPRSSYLRFAAELPNECWQSDFTHYRLAGGSDTEIIGWLDDHSRLIVHLTAHRRVTGPIVVASFRAACAAYGVPASTLTDNGLVYTTRFAGGRGGRNAFEHELARLGIRQKNGKPNHPQTQGKIERLWQTLHRWLAAQPVQPETLAQLQTLLDTFTGIYNHQRAHRSLPHRATPATAYAARPKASPGNSGGGPHDRVRADIIDNNSTVTLRTGGHLYHLGVGRTHARTRVLLLVHDLHARTLNPPPGELLRDLTLDPSRDYQPTGQPPGPAPRNPRKHNDSEP